MQILQVTHYNTSTGPTCLSSLPTYLPTYLSSLPTYLSPLLAYLSPLLAYLSPLLAYLSSLPTYLHCLPTYLHCLPIFIAYLSSLPTYLRCLPIFVACLPFFIACLPIFIACLPIFVAYLSSLPTYVGTYFRCWLIRVSFNQVYNWPDWNNYVLMLRNEWPCLFDAATTIQLCRQKSKVRACDDSAVLLLERVWISFRLRRSWLREMFLRLRTLWQTWQGLPCRAGLNRFLQLLLMLTFLIVWYFLQ